MSEVTKESKTSNLASRMEALNLRKTETEMETKLNSCGNCGIKCSLSCAKCKKTYYCSVTCQKAHLKQHKPICFPAKAEIGHGVRTIKNMPGSFWVATRDIKQGENIFTDYPLTIGPGRADCYVPGQQICLGCHDVLKNYVLETDSRKCGQCGWPLCGTNCTEIQRHLTFECQTLRPNSKNDGETFEKAVIDSGAAVLYQRIRFLRIFALRTLDSIKWEKILNLHTPDNLIEKSNINISDIDSIISDNEGFTAEQICQMLAVEIYHRRTSCYQSNDKEELVIFDKHTRLDIGCMENCVTVQIPNAEKLRKNPHGITVIAAKHITKGERLIISPQFMKQMDGTKPRRQILKKFGFFCKCVRCFDRTELGTNFSAVKCTKCDKGLLLPIDPWDENSKWNCNSEVCSASFPASDLDKYVDKIQKAADILNIFPISTGCYSNAGSFCVETHKLSEVEALAKIVIKNEAKLNPKHYIIMNVKELLIRRLICILHKGSETTETYDPQKLSMSHFLIVTLEEYALQFFEIPITLFPPLSVAQVNAYYYLGMSKFYRAQQDIREGESFDVILELLKLGVDLRRNVDIRLKELISCENGEFLKKSLENAQDAALKLCNLSPEYSTIPAKLIESSETVCPANSEH